MVIVCVNLTKSIWLERKIPAILIAAVRFYYNAYPFKSEEDSWTKTIIVYLQRKTNFMIACVYDSAEFIQIKFNFFAFDNENKLNAVDFRFMFAVECRCCPSLLMFEVCTSLQPRKFGESHDCWVGGFILSYFSFSFSWCVQFQVHSKICMHFENISRLCSILAIQPHVYGRLLLVQTKNGPLFKKLSIKTTASIKMAQII